MGHHFIGTSGWSYPWKGIFYPEELKSKDYLSYYSTRFLTVEVNSSFYHMTRPSTVLKWYQETPHNFRFALKMHKSITHLKRLENIENEVATQMNSFLLLKEKLGPVLIQLPASLKYNPEYEDFFSFLRKKYPAVIFALEARNTTWFDCSVQEMLEKYSLSWVIADAGDRFPQKEMSTSNEIYLRFHGVEKLYSSSYSDEKLSLYAEKISMWLQSGKRVWIFFNNTMNGAAVKNAFTIESMIHSF